MRQMKYCCGKRTAGTVRGGSKETAQPHHFTWGSLAMTSTDVYEGTNYNDAVKLNFQFSLPHCHSHPIFLRATTKSQAQIVNSSLRYEIYSHPT
jgi:hypothetical protein